jgi:ABC-type polysaccharide/polyol phosphate export permease
MLNSRRETMAALVTLLGLLLISMGQGYGVKWLSVIGAIVAAPVLLLYAAAFVGGILFVIVRSIGRVFGYCAKGMKGKSGGDGGM